MWQAAFTLTLGFVLTVLIGGAYASYLQQRSWQHQNQSRLDEEERKQAGDICTALSESIDKRRYRTLRLLQAIGERTQEGTPNDQLRDLRSEYENALTDWNGQFTTRLVSVGAYFGYDVRDFLKNNIDRRFQEADENIEKLYRTVAAPPDTIKTINTADVASTVGLLDAVGEAAYELNSTMMMHIMQGKIGRNTPHQLPPSATGQSIMVGGKAAAPTSMQVAPKRSFWQLTTTAQAPWHQGPSIAISAVGLFWVICMSLPMWDLPGSEISGWELLTSSGTWSGKLWSWLLVLAMLAIGALAAATLAQNWSRYRAIVQCSAIAIGAVSMVTLVVLGAQATDSYKSYCDGQTAVASCLSEQGLGIGYYLGLTATALTAASGVWGANQSQRRRTGKLSSQPSAASHSTL